MFLERIKVDAYGPLRDVDLDLPPGLVLFAGRNESGKTLLVEAVIRQLFEGPGAHLEGLDRVARPPVGHVEIVRDGDRFVRPDQPFEPVFAPLTPRDLRSAFIIRDVDLRRPVRASDFGRSAYLREVTDRLTGARTSDIEAVREELADLGRLTSASSDALVVDRQPAKLRSALGTAKTLRTELREYLAQAESDGIIGAYRRRVEIEREQDAIDDTIASLEVAKRHTVVDRAEAMLEEIHETEAELAELDDRATAELPRLEQLATRVAALDDEHSAIGQTEYRAAIAGVGGLLALSLIAAIVSPVPFLEVVVVGLVAAFFAVGYGYLRASRRRAARDGILEEAHALGVDGDAVGAIRDEIESRIDRIETRRRRLERAHAGAVGRFRQLLDVEAASRAEFEELLEARRASVPAVSVDFDEERLETLRSRRSTLAKERDAIDESLHAHERQLHDLDARLRDLPLDRVVEVERPRIETVADLEPAAAVVTTFIESVETRADRARTAISVLESLDAQERREINYLFREDSFLLRWLGPITGGNYVDLRYDEHDETILVERRDGQTLRVDQVSQGTYDALYLSTRVTLARDLLEGDPGFLILDDAFIHVDDARIRPVIEALQALVETGWQVLYFSIRSMVREAIDAADHGKVIPLPPLEYSP